MTLSTPKNPREAFASLRLPRVHKDKAFYLNHSGQFHEGLEALMRTFGVETRHFVSADEHRWAYHQGSAWVWEELCPGLSADSPKRRVSAAASLYPLLSGFAAPGQEKTQESSISAYEEWFYDFALCYQDFIEVGLDSVSDFLDQEETGNTNRQAFFGDEEDLKEAREKNELWTMLNLKQGTLYAASTLRGVLLRAWDNDPRLVLSRKMQEAWPEPTDDMDTVRRLKKRF